jgi:hypothetical protein
VVGSGWVGRVDQAGALALRRSAGPEEEGELPC